MPISASAPISTEISKRPACRILPTSAKIAQVNLECVIHLMTEKPDEILTIEKVATYLEAGRYMALPACLAGTVDRCLHGYAGGQA